MKRIKFHVLLLLLVVAWSCEQEGDYAISRPEPTPSTTNEAVSSSTQQATDSEMKNQAINEINYSFNGIYKISNRKQVQGLSRQQFKELLKGSKIAFIEKDIQEVIEAEGTKFIVLRRIRSQETGKLVNVALIRVPEELHEKFKPVMAIEPPPGNITRRPNACFYKASIPSRQRTSSDPKTLCITRVKFISDYDYCPYDECVGTSPVVEPPVSEAIATLAVADSEL